jgi:hypothetical protein
MSDNNCSLEFYDWNWNWISYDCLNDMSNTTKWRNEISNATVWRNDTWGSEMPYIWSYWEEQYIENTDWDELEDLDWHNPMCNMTNVTAENRHWLPCDAFGFNETYEWGHCSVYYTVESCDMANFTCDASYSIKPYGTDMWEYDSWDCADDFYN